MSPAGAATRGARCSPPMAPSRPRDPSRSDSQGPSEMPDPELQPPSPDATGAPPDLRAFVSLASWNFGRQHLRQCHRYCSEDVVCLQECRAPGVMSITPKHNWFYGERGHARHGMPAVGNPQDVWHKVTASSSSRWHSMACWVSGDGMRPEESMSSADSL